MRRIGGDACVELSSGDAALGQRRRVIGVNKIVGYARVLRLGGEFLRQHLAGSKEISVGLVGRRSRHDQRQRGENGYLGILRKRWCRRSIAWAYCPTRARWPAPSSLANSTSRA